MTAARRWVRSHLADAPASLLAAMSEALPAEDGPVAEALAAGALALYGRVLAGNGGRGDALPLLAADALLTHAIEVLVEEDPSRLPAFITRWGAAGRIGALAHQVES